MGAFDSLSTTVTNFIYIYIWKTNYSEEGFIYNWRLCQCSTYSCFTCKLFTLASVSRWAFTWVWVTTSFSQVSRTLSVLDDIAWMVLIRPSTSDSPRSFSSLWDRSMGTNDNWYHRHPHFAHFFLVLRQVQELVSFFGFFDFHSLVCEGGEVYSAVSSLFCQLLRIIMRIFLRLILKDEFRFGHVSFSYIVKF